MEFNATSGEYSTVLRTDFVNTASSAILMKNSTDKYL